jgi:eukaryotic-like serine/threonine-protein kinase
MAGGGATDPRIGTVLKDKWHVDARLGRGGVATVYAATHRNGNRVAIKVLNREVARNPDIRGRFLREGYMANAVAHPGVVRVLDDDTTPEGQPFLVMDLLTGELVDARRNRMGGRLPLVEVLRIGDQVLDVLSAAHERGIIHRDIKPENVFLCETGEVKVLDFGIARMREAAAGEMTATGMLLGTPEFMSPEQASGVQGSIDLLTDIWATGATLFTLLSGEAVHEAANATAQILATVSRPARSLASVTSDVPALVVEVIDRALAFDKRARWQNARAMQRALADAGRGVPTGGPPHAAVLRKPAASLETAGPASDDERTIERGPPEPSSGAPTNRRPPAGPPDGESDDLPTTAQEHAPVSAPTHRDFDPAPRLGVDVVPVSDEPTQVATPRPVPSHEAPTRVSGRPIDFDATVAVSRPPVERPERPMLQETSPAHDDASRMSTLTSPGSLPPDLAKTRVMPMRPDSQGGFILPKKGPSASETPTVPPHTTRAKGSAWTLIAVVVGTAVLLLWVVIVVVLRALFR